MNSSRFLPGLALPAIAIALVAVLALMAGGALGGSGDPVDPSPSQPPTATPGATPTAGPSDDPGDGRPIPLDIATDHDVVVVIDDTTGTVVGAKSGRAGDGMSVRWNDSLVENVDGATKIRLTWVGLPLDDEVKLSISEADGRYTFEIVQQGPYPNTDALGFDRVLVLEFDEPVDADDVDVKISYHPGTDD